MSETLGQLRKQLPLGDAYAFREDEAYIIFYDPTVLDLGSIQNLPPSERELDILFIPVMPTADGKMAMLSVATESKEAIKEWARGL